MLENQAIAQKDNVTKKELPLYKHYTPNDHYQKTKILCAGRFYNLRVHSAQLSGASGAAGELCGTGGKDAQHGAWESWNLGFHHCQPAGEHPNVHKIYPNV